MKHPKSRSERRHNGEVWRDKQRFIMVATWSSYRGNYPWKLDPTQNNMWWGRKKTYGHGNRCACHYKKIIGRRKRRVALDREIIENIKSFVGLP